MKDDLMSVALVIISGCQKREVIILREGDKIAIGRDPECDFQLSDASVSRKHCYISHSNGNTWVEDADSMNGIFINEEPVKKGSIIPGNIIKIGSVHLKLKGSLQPREVIEKTKRIKNEKQTFRAIHTKKRSDTTFAIDVSPLILQRNLILLHDTVKLIQQRTSVPELLSAVLETLLSKFLVERGCFVLKVNNEEITSDFIYRTRIEKDGEEYFSDETFSINYVVLNQVLNQGEGLIGEGILCENESRAHSNLFSIICVPIDVHNGIQGAVYLESHQGGRGFRKEDLDLITAVSRQVGFAVEKTLLVEKIAASEQRFRNIYQSIVENYTDLLYRRNADRSFAIISPSVESFLGVSLEILWENHKIWDNCIYPEDRKFVLKEQEQVFQGKHLCLEYRMIKGNGEIIWVEETSYPIRNKANQITCMQATVKDITERKKSTIELKKSNEQLKKFAKLVTHDLKEPLRKIIMFGDIFNKKYLSILDEKGVEYAKRTVNAAHTMLNLLENLRKYIDILVTPCRISQVDLHVVANKVKQELAPQISELKGEMEIGELQVIEADPQRIAQMIYHLVKNSLKYSSDKPPFVKIYSTLETQNVSGEIFHNCQVCKIFVEDNGVGIEERHTARIFELCKKLQFSQSEVGIGLAVCQKIAEQHRGSIEVKSKPGQGSVFIVSLPFQKRPQQQQETKEIFQVKREVR